LFLRAATVIIVKNVRLIGLRRIVTNLYPRPAAKIVCYIAVFFGFAGVCLPVDGVTISDIGFISRFSRRAPPIICARASSRRFTVAVEHNGRNFAGCFGAKASGKIVARTSGENEREKSDEEKEFKF
jgi:hypothetical protein